MVWPQRTFFVPPPPRSTFNCSSEDLSETNKNMTKVAASFACILDLTVHRICSGGICVCVVVDIYK